MFYQPDGLCQPNQDVAQIVCWSRMQAEAGQGLERIIQRKELERRATGGLFFWGVGNAPGGEPARLARSRTPVQAIFSVMKSKPKARDANASDLNLWRGYLDEFGVEQDLPDGVLVTSRAGDDGSRQRAHYALVCRSDASITLNDHGAFNPKAFRNVGGRGAPVGASQVTALLRLADPHAPDDASYRSNIRATLAGGYWVKLTDPVRLSGRTASKLLGELEEIESLSINDWLELIAAARGANGRTREQSTLFESPVREFASAAALS